MTNASEHLLRGDDAAANPSLSDDELALLHAVGSERQLEDGEVLYRPGVPLDVFYVVLSGQIRIEDGDGEERRVLSELHRGNFLGEFGLLSGGLSYMTNVAHGRTSLLCVPVPALLEVVASHSVLSETILRAFLLRRAILVGEGLGVKVIGSARSPETRQVVDFLARNRIPHELVEIGPDGLAETVLRDFSVAIDDTPLVVVGGRILRNPSTTALAAGLGVTRAPRPAGVLDLLVVGAGPAGLAASVYGASEGLSTALLDAVGVGGQAGTSSRIENYLGFPAGISGGELAARAALQASKFGACILTPAKAVGLHSDGDSHRVALGDGEELVAHSVVIASGARYRGLSLGRVEDFAGAGVYYAATQFEARACREGIVAIVGGGNSAGQAALFLAEQARRVMIIVRRPELSATMSHYLTSRIDSHDRIEVLGESEVRELHGEERLTAITIESTKTGARSHREVCALFIFTGAEPHTEWLRSTLELDRAGFVLTGSDITDPVAVTVPCQTSVAGVFAVGDVRSGSTKRVATAVGEGSMAIRFVHEHLTTLSR